MSSPGAKDPVLVAGRPPAVKAGGVRVTQHHKPTHQSSSQSQSQADSKLSDSDDPNAAEERSGDEGEKEESKSSDVSSTKRDKPVVISGAVVSEAEAYPAAAQSYYQNEKRQAPIHQKRPAEKIHNINQPR